MAAFFTHTADRPSTPYPGVDLRGPYPSGTGCSVVEQRPPISLDTGRRRSFDCSFDVPERVAHVLAQQRRADTHFL